MLDIRCWIPAFAGMTHGTGPWANRVVVPTTAKRNGFLRSAGICSPSAGRGAKYITGSQRALGSPLRYEAEIISCLRTQSMSQWRV